jgi:hypothetical protein
MKRLVSYALGVALVASASSAAALTVPFTEDFTSDVSGWINTANAPLTFQATGGPDGGSYASTTLNYFGFTSPFGGGPVVFRGHNANNASGDAFVGNWVTGGVQLVTAWVKQDTGVDLTFFLRVAGSFNFPGAVIGNTGTVPSGVWTLVSWLIDPNDPGCQGEGVTCAQALADVGNVQFGTSAPSSLTTQDVAFALAIDKVSIASVPEPGTALLAAFGLLGLGVFSRRRAA